MTDASAGEAEPSRGDGSGDAGAGAAMLFPGDDDEVDGSPVRLARPREAVVSLLSGDQFEFVCAEGKNTAASEMLAEALKGFKLPSEAADVFALHCVSTSLSIELKPHHQPFKILRKWPELLALFSTSPDPDTEAPLLYLKRASLCHQGLERKHSHPRVVELLVQEMTFNVVYSFYPCDLDEAARLAAIHLAIATEPGPEPTKDDVAVCEGCQLPDHLRRKASTRKWRRAVLDAHHALRSDEAGGAGDLELMLRYLKIGRAWPWYGATWFYGYVEPPEPKGIVLRERPDELVRVGVNLDGVHVVRERDNEVVLSLAYSELQYNSYDADSGAEEPSFLIEYSASAADENGPPGATAPTPGGAAAAAVDERLLPDGKAQLVVWTPQASMIDVLVSSHIEALEDWDEYIRQRKLERVASYRPSALARGRKKHDSSGSGGGGGGGFFTLTKFMTRRSSNDTRRRGSTEGGGTALSPVTGNAHSPEGI